MSIPQYLKGIRCPVCLSESAFVVQMTMNVVMEADGIDFFGCSQPEDDHFPGRVISPDDGFVDGDPIQCFERRGGCGHRGSVEQFRIENQNTSHPHDEKQQVPA